MDYANLSETEIKESIKKQIKESEFKFTPKDQKIIAQTLEKIVIDHVSPAEAMGFTKEDLDQLYSFAYSFYTAGQYKDALQLFLRLYSIDSKDKRFDIGIAACYHMQKDYDKALLSYYRCFLQDEALKDPTIYWHISDCYHKKGELVKAILSLNLCLELCKNRPELEAFHLKASGQKEYVLREYLAQPGSSEEKLEGRENLVSAENNKAKG